MPTSSPESEPIGAGSKLNRRTAWLLLAVIVAAGGALRLVDLRQSPPGLNQDEAANAWNAWCLLKTGMDQTGQRWPVFYSRFMGENRSTLFVYWMLPFQAIGGMSIWTTRLPSAVGGILTLPLIYYIGARLWGRPTGLVAAALLAVAPWHIQQCRWGHEASLCPLLACATLAALLWAGLPPGDTNSIQPRPVRALLAGAMAGLSCYGYPAMRLFLPVFLLMAILLNWRSWWQMLRSGGKGRLAIALWCVGGLLTFGPLVHRHLSDPHISKRLTNTRVWNDEDGWGQRAKKVLGRYPGHFGPAFLFEEGDDYKIQSPPEGGQFLPYMAPLMLLGVVVTAFRALRSPADRVLLAWLVAYPVGDCLTSHESMHALRSLPGLCGLVLVGSAGVIAAAGWLRRPTPAFVWLGGTLLGLVVVLATARFAQVYYGNFNDWSSTTKGFQVDLVRACEWVKPRQTDFDAIFWTTDEMNMPYLITLVTLDYDPHQWHLDPREIRDRGGWDYYLRYGKMRFLYEPPSESDLKELRSRHPGGRVLFVVRPNEPGFSDPVHEVTLPRGRVVLWMCERTL